VSTIEVRVPDIGNYQNVPVIELLVRPGERVAKDQGLVTLESDKATMEVPAPVSGVVRELCVQLGDTVSQGTRIAVIDTELGSATTGRDAIRQPPAPAVPDAPAPRPSGATSRQADIECEICVLGSGPGGYTAAFRAADLGRRTVLIERHETLGGVCLNVGCIPSKALLHAARLIDEAAHAAEIGIAFSRPAIDLDKLRAYKDRVVAQMSGGLAAMAKQRKVEIVRGSGTFVSPHEIAVDGPDGRRSVRFEQAIIAAGSQALKLPGLPWGDPRLMDSTDALRLDAVPKTLLVIGGGIIGLEMACVYAALGSEVSVVELLDQLMPGADADLVRPLAQRLGKRYRGIHLKTRVVRIEPEADGLHAFFEGDPAPAAQRFERVLVAVGRVPNGRQIGAERAGVAVDERGYIPVDRQLRTNVPHIFAIGDIVGPPMLAHKATHQGKVAAEVAAGLHREFVAQVIPSVAYTDPEVAWVGLTETEAKRSGIAYGIGKFPHAASGRAVGVGRSEGFTKLIFDETHHRILGAGIVCPNAGELIAELALAIEMGCEAADLGLTIHPHPTFAESIAMAAEVYEGTVTDLYLPRRS
jgi:dihydrolipoamide dehydrogenase